MRRYETLLCPRSGRVLRISHFDSDDVGAAVREMRKHPGCEWVIRDLHDRERVVAESPDRRRRGAAAVGDA
jgi:hypothetical protein